MSFVIHRAKLTLLTQSQMPNSSTLLVSFTIGNASFEYVKSTQAL